MGSPFPSSAPTIIRGRSIDDFFEVPPFRPSFTTLFPTLGVGEYSMPYCVGFVLTLV